jgi:hypothetical protein
MPLNDNSYCYEKQLIEGLVWNVCFSYKTIHKTTKYHTITIEILNLGLLLYVIPECENLCSECECIKLDKS